MATLFGRALMAVIKALSRRPRVTLPSKLFNRPLPRSAPMSLREMRMIKISRSRATAPPLSPRPPLSILQHPSNSSTYFPYRSFPKLNPVVKPYDWSGRFRSIPSYFRSREIRRFTRPFRRSVRNFYRNSLFGDFSRYAGQGIRRSFMRFTRPVRRSFRSYYRNSAVWDGSPRPPPSLGGFVGRGIRRFTRPFRRSVRDFYRNSLRDDFYGFRKAYTQVRTPTTGKIRIRAWDSRPRPQDPWYGRSIRDTADRIRRVAPSFDTIGRFAGRYVLPGAFLGSLGYQVYQGERDKDLYSQSSSPSVPVSTYSGRRRVSRRPRNRYYKGRRRVYRSRNRYYKGRRVYNKNRSRSGHGYSRYS